MGESTVISVCRDIVGPVYRRISMATQNDLAYDFGNSKRSVGLGDFLSFCGEVFYLVGKLEDRPPQDTGITAHDSIEGS